MSKNEQNTTAIICKTSRCYSYTTSSRNTFSEFDNEEIDEMYANQLLKGGFVLSFVQIGTNKALFLSLLRTLSTEPPEVLSVIPVSYQLENVDVKSVLVAMSKALTSFFDVENFELDILQTSNKIKNYTELAYIIQKWVLNSQDENPEQKEMSQLIIDSMFNVKQEIKENMGIELNLNKTIKKPIKRGKRPKS